MSSEYSLNTSIDLIKIFLCLFQADVDLTFQEGGSPKADDTYRYSKRPEIKVGSQLLCYLKVSTAP